VARLLFRGPATGSKEEAGGELQGMIEEIAVTVLAPFEDAYLNKHLAIALLEAIVAKVVPELAVDRAGGPGGGSVSALLAERGVGQDVAAA